MTRPALLFLALLLACLAAAPATAVAANDAPPHTANGSEPRDGSRVLELSEVWHRGHDDDDIIFGSISSVQLGPDGLVYVLDQQQSQVPVFDDAGELVRTLSREGEGPGETRHPEHMVFLPDEVLGLAQYINGRIVCIRLDGTPLDTIMPPGYEASGGGMSSIRRVRWRGGSFVINGARIQPADDGMVRTQYLKRCDERGNPQVEYLARSTASNLMRDGWVEKKNYFPSHGRWDIDGQGNVIAATERNDYLLTVYAPDGSVVRTFGREFSPRKRTEAEKQEIRDSLVVLRDGQRVQVEVDVEDNHPAVFSVRVRPDGEIWVLTPVGTNGQPDGIMLTYDVFDAAGAYVRQVSLACDGDPDEDRIEFLGTDRFALVRGAVQARRNTFGGSQGEEEEAPIHDLKVYSF